MNIEKLIDVMAEHELRIFLDYAQERLKVIQEPASPLALLGENAEYKSLLKSG